MNDQKKILELIQLAYDYGLDGMTKLEDIGLGSICRVFNGTGPAWFPEVIRNAIDKLSWVFLPAVMIHDVDYSYGEGNYEDFARANNRLEYNMLTIADSEYGWYNPMRYVRRRQARIFAELCRAFGWIAYNKTRNYTKGSKK